MKKKLILPVVAGMALMMAGCPKEQSAVDNVDTTETVTTEAQVEVTPIDKINNEVSLKLDVTAFETVPESIHLTITNQSSDVVSTGSDYELSVLKGDAWEAVNMEGFAFDKMIHPIGPGEGEGFEINLFTREIKYEKGTYKITKQFGNDVGEFSKEVEFVVK